MSKPKWEPIEDNKILSNGMTLKEMSDYDIAEYPKASVTTHREQEEEK